MTPVLGNLIRTTTTAVSKYLQNKSQDTLFSFYCKVVIYSIYAVVQKGLIVTIFFIKTTPRQASIPRLPPVGYFAKQMPDGSIESHRVREKALEGDT